MDIFEIIILALIQGVTEFLPISSSAHLILPSQVLGWQDQGLAFDVAVHVGSLVAVMAYFRKDIIQLLLAWCNHVGKQQKTAESDLAWCVILATIPAVVFGLLVDMFFEDDLRQLWVIATTTIVFGLLLAVADRRGGLNKGTEITFKIALIIGLFQAIALIPGTSRSGITMTAALFLGLNRETSARFSFLLSIPLILAAGLLKTLELIQSDVPVAWMDIFLGAAFSAVAAYACITLFLAWINRIGFMPFVVYRLILGLALFAVII
ncbi:MAG: undecaprenyl-diphosphate phosphatase [Pseudomonadales bacterium]|nr:undecaprenyl-diphosphate phosphatase [Pseudomonadales bacterium]